MNLWKYKEYFRVRRSFWQKPVFHSLPRICVCVTVIVQFANTIASVLPKWIRNYLSMVTISFMLFYEFLNIFNHLYNTLLSTNCSCIETSFGFIQNKLFWHILSLSNDWPILRKSNLWVAVRRHGMAPLRLISSRVPESVSENEALITPFILSLFLWRQPDKNVNSQYLPHKTLQL